jgi:hypothetical protein
VVATIQGSDGVNSKTRRARLNKALAEIPYDWEFTASDVEEIMTRQYKVATLSTRAIGFLLAKTPGVSRAGPRSWVKQKVMV